MLNICGTIGRVRVAFQARKLADVTFHQPLTFVQNHLIDLLSPECRGVIRHRIRPL